MTAKRTLVRELRVCALIHLLGPFALAQYAVERVSLPNGPGEADAASGTCSVSADGGLVAFDSGASNLVAGDTNGFYDVFVRDRAAGTTRRVSVGLGGAEPNLSSMYPRISADGRFVFFISTASNLVAGDVNAQTDVFAHELSTGVTSLVSVSTSGAQANFGAIVGDASADGRFVVMSSFSTNLVAGDFNGCDDIFLRDRSAGTTRRVSVDSNGVAGVSPSESPSISGDGRFVVFASVAGNLVLPDFNGWDIFLHDTATGATERISIDSSGVQADANSMRPAVSDDGRYVAFESDANNLVANDNNALTDIFVRDRTSGTTTRVSLGLAGADPFGASSRARISGDGRFVAFESLAPNLVPGDTNQVADVFLADRVLATIARSSVSASGVQADARCHTPSIAAGGGAVAFTSLATTLVAGDDNAVDDAFVGRVLPAVPSSYCTAGTSSNGCVPALSANAQPRVSGAGACQIVASGVEGQRSGMVFYGVDNDAFAPLPWGSSSSFLCVKSPIQRTGAQSTGGTINACNGAMQLDWSAFHAANPSALGAPWSVGSQAFVQAWYRDPPSPKSTHLSNALVLTYLP